MILGLETTSNDICCFLERKKLFGFSIKDGPRFVVRKLFHLFRDFAPESPQEVVDQSTVEEREVQGFLLHHYLGSSHDAFDGRDGAASDLDLGFGAVFELAAGDLTDEFRAVGHHAKY